jgi:hypothetical protein
MSAVNLDGTVGGGAFLGTTTVANISSPVYVELNDYTSPEVGTAYYTNMQVIENFYNQAITTPANQNISTDITSADVANVQQALANLLSLAQNGITANSTPGTSQTTNSTSFLTQPMASNLNLLLLSFQAVGAANPASAITADQLAEWKDLATTSSSIQSLMNAILYATAGNQSVQSIIDLDYVATGNILVNDQLSGLDQALSTTQGVLSTLTNLQNIQNELVIPPSQQFVVPTTIPSITNDAGANESTLMNAYQTGTGAQGAGGVAASGASAFFTSPLYPIVPSTIVSPTTKLLTPYGVSQFNNLLAIQQSLLAMVPVLSAITDPNTASSVDSLVGTVKTLLHDFSTLFESGGVQAVNLTSGAQKSSALQRFLLDGNDPKFAVANSPAGQGQNDLTFAITAGQGLNNQQNQLVQQYLYIFQQFYESASSVLSAINTMMATIAQNIGQG